MIYLILTTSLINRYDVSSSVTQESRLQRYLYAIQETLHHLPSSGEIQPVIVENNGFRPTPLDHFTWTTHGQVQTVPVIYTTHNRTVYRNKGVNELLDIQSVLHSLSVLPTDMIIKVTGRYRVTSPRFFDLVCITPDVDSFIAPYNVHTEEWDTDDCVLGMYAIRAMYLYLLYPSALDLYESAEKGMARYIRQTIARRWEMSPSWGELGIECVFANDTEQRRIHV